MGTPDRTLDNAHSEPPNTIKGNVYIAYDWVGSQGGDKVLYLCVDTDLTDERLKAGLIVMIDRVRGSISNLSRESGGVLTGITWLLGAEDPQNFEEIQSRFRVQYERVMPQAIAYMSAFDNGLSNRIAHEVIDYKTLFPKPFENDLPSHTGVKFVTEVRTRIVPYVLEDGPRHPESFSYYLGTATESALTGRPATDFSMAEITDMMPKQDQLEHALAQGAAEALEQQD